MYIGKAHGRAAFVGEVYEVIIFETVLSDSEIEKVHNLLSNKWMIETSKPTEVQLDQSISEDGVGTESRPYKFIQSALDRIRSGGKLKIKQGHYDESIQVTGNVIIESVDGTIKIGTPKNDE